jgi:hypothetical protein
LPYFQDAWFIEKQTPYRAIEQKPKIGQLFRREMTPESGFLEIAWGIAIHGEILPFFMSSASGERRHIRPAGEKRVKFSDRLQRCILLRSGLPKKSPHTNKGIARLLRDVEVNDSSGVSAATGRGYPFHTSLAFPLATKRR